MDGNIVVGQNLDLGYDGNDLIVKKYKDYITIGLKSHPLWSTVGINRHGITYSGSSVNSVNYGEGVISSILNSKIILSKYNTIDEVTNFFDNYKFYVGNDAGTYIISDNKNIYYFECDSKNFYYRLENKYTFSTNKFIKLKENNLFINHETDDDALKRESYFKSIIPIHTNIFSQVKQYLSSHKADICAHSAKTIRYTTCTTIIDKEEKLLYFTKKLPCKIKTKEEFFTINLDFK
jgi:hypothetical protein